MEPPPPRSKGQFPPLFANLFRSSKPPPSTSAAAAAAPVPPLPTGAAVAGMATEQDRRAQRLAKNRESARQSRRRKKEKLELLSERMWKLNGELEDLRQATAATLRSLDDPTGEERHALWLYDFARLRRLLSPPHARFWLWLHRQDSWLSPSSSASGSSSSASKVGERMMQEQQEQGSPQGWEAGDGQKLWPLLCFELQFKGEQEERARALFLGQASDVEMKEHVEALAGVVDAADALERGLDMTARRLQEKMAGVRRVLTPTQVKVLERHATAGRNDGDVE